MGKKQEKGWDENSSKGKKGGPASGRPKKEGQKNNMDKTGMENGAAPSAASETDGEEMTVELDLEDGSHVVCAIVTILECQGKDYIVLLPLDENGENNDGEVWFYHYFEDENDTNAEPVLEYIEDDEEYEIVADAFDEYLDNAEFDEYVEGSST